MTQGNFNSDKMLQASTMTAKNKDYSQFSKPKSSLYSQSDPALSGVVNKTRTTFVGNFS